MTAIEEAKGPSVATPLALVARVEQLTGRKVESAQPVSGGYTPATRLLCQTAQGRFFVKAGATPLTSDFLRREIQVYNTIRGPFMPELIAWEEDEVAPLLIIEDLARHLWPPPWDPARVARVVDQIHAMHQTPAQLEPFQTILPGRHVGWATVAADPAPLLRLGIVDQGWLDQALPTLIAAEAACETTGSSLTHWDLRSDNICLTPDRVIFIDWNLAALGNPELDLGFWLPSLAHEGGPLPETILPAAPTIAAWVAGFFAARAGLPNIPDAPRVRLVQQQQLATALPWAVRALALPPLKAY